MESKIHALKPREAWTVHFENGPEQYQSTITYLQCTLHKDKK